VNGIQIVPVAAAPAAGPIGIDFMGTHTTRMAASERAGVVTQSGWNSAAGPTGAALPLVDASGTATGAMVTWSATGEWMTPIADAPGNARMMKGYLDTSSTSTTRVQVSGLVPRAYDVYVYIDGANGSAERAGTYTISGAGITPTTITAIDAVSSNFGTTFTDARDGVGNYVRFSVNAAAFTLTAVPSTASTTTRRAPVNGIQIVPVAAAPAAGPIGIDFMGTHTTRMAASERAGVVTQSGWNSAAGPTGAALPLVDASGTATGAMVTWSATGEWMTPIADAPGNARMMKGYLDTSSTSTTRVQVSGLVRRAYDIYVYIDGANGSAERAGTYTISGAGITPTTITAIDAVSNNFGTTFTDARDGVGNYVRFSVNAAAFTLTAVPSAASTTTRRAPVNGIQIVPMPSQR
jgi:hypothetical protein